MSSFYITAAVCIARLLSVHSQDLNASSIIKPLNTYLKTHGNINRDLEAFSTLNNIISEITIVLPDADVANNGLDITITDLICYESNVQDIRVTRSSLSDAVDRVAIDVIGLTVTCNFRWNYEWSILSVVSGSGSGRAVLDPSSGAFVNLDIQSGTPPRDVRVDSCTADTRIDDLDLDGDGLGAIASIINLFKNMVMGVIEEEVNGAVCSAIDELGKMKIQRLTCAMIVVVFSLFNTHRNTGNEDGALVFVVESNEQVVNYETGTVNSSSSGIGWLVLLITLLIIYSVSCCFLGAYCSGRIYYPKRIKSTSYKSMEEEDHNKTEVDCDNRAEVAQTMSLESSEIDIESQTDTNDVNRAASDVRDP